MRCSASMTGMAQSCHAAATTPDIESGRLSVHRPTALRLAPPSRRRRSGHRIDLAHGHSLRRQDADEVPGPGRIGRATSPWKAAVLRPIGAVALAVPFCGGLAQLPPRAPILAVPEPLRSEEISHVGRRRRTVPEVIMRLVLRSLQRVPTYQRLPAIFRLRCSIPGWP